MGTISSNTFKKNVLKVVNFKASKKAAKQALMKSRHASIATVSLSVSNDVNDILEVSQSYLLGMQMRTEMKDKLKDGFGELGSSLVVLSRLLKERLPSSTKKAKLVGTRGAGILSMAVLAGSINKCASRMLFDPPPVKTVEKEVTIPSVDGAAHKEVRPVEVIDAEKFAERQEYYVEQIKKELEPLLDLYWRLCYNIFEQPPAYIFQHYMKGLQEAYPNVQFQIVPDTDTKEPENVKEQELLHA
jgi:hypothetical protein